MTDSSDRFRNLSALLASVCDETAGPDDVAQIETLANDDESLHYVIEYLQLDGLLHWENGEGSIANAPNATDNRAPVSRDSLPIVIAEGCDDLMPSVPSSSAFGFIHNTISYFSQGMPFSYLAATVLVGIGLLLGSLVQVSPPVLTARQSDRSSLHRASGRSSGTEFVGRITGLVACRFEKGAGVSRVQGSGVGKTAEPALGAFVPLGCEYLLASGLMEITYDGGAKVVLQGPCNYEVKSENSGFLSVGKLRARVETKGEGRGRKAEGSGGLKSALRLLPSPFVVNTPTVTVTDLGTEFGVEVAEDGECEVHVLEGVVEAQLLGSGNRQSQTVQLKEGEARQYRPKLGLVTVIPADRTKFAPMHAATMQERRERWLEYSRRLRKDPTLVAYYTFEPDGRGNVTRLANQSPAGAALDGTVEGGEWVSGRLPGKLALYFHGPDSGDRVILPEQERFEFPGEFSVAVWFKQHEFRAIMPMLLAKGPDSWRLAYDDRGPLRFCTKGYTGILWQGTDGQTRIDDGQWHLGVGVYEPIDGAARLRVYVDGRLEGESKVSTPRVHNDKAVWLGSSDHATGNRENSFTGWIDEVAIFSRILSTEEVRAMFKAGEPVQQHQTTR